MFEVVNWDIEKMVNVCYFMNVVDVCVVKGEIEVDVFCIVCCSVLLVFVWLKFIIILEDVIVLCL